MTVTDERCSDVCEATAYFVVSEALANISRHAEARHATIGIARAGADLRVEVTDDGVGGADLAAGSGLRGLADRVAALGGALTIESPPGAGTRLLARIPCE